MRERKGRGEVELDSEVWRRKGKKEKKKKRRKA